ncbi:hypothetical protein [Mycobacterium sp. NPDC050441]
MPQTTFHTLGDCHDQRERRGAQWRLVKRIKNNRGTVDSLEPFDG